MMQVILLPYMLLAIKRVTDKRETQGFTPVISWRKPEHFILVLNLASTSYHMSLTVLQSLIEMSETNLLHPFPAVGATAAAAAPAVVAALRVWVPGPGVVCVFQPLPRLLPVLDEDAGSVGRRGQPWSPRRAYPRRGFMRGNGRGRRCNLSQEQILGQAG